MMNMDKTLDLVNKWRMKHGEQIEGLSEFLITEVFQNFENVKKDNMTLLVVDLHKLFILLKDKLRKNSFEEKKTCMRASIPHLLAGSKECFQITPMQEFKFSEFSSL